MCGKRRQAVYRRALLDDATQACLFFKTMPRVLSPVINTAELEAPNVTQQDRGLLLVASGLVSVCSIGVGRVAPPSPAAFVAEPVRDRVCRWWFSLVLL